MRHSPARRSSLSQLGRTGLLADRVRHHPRHRGPLALSTRRPKRHRALRLAALVGGACAGLGLVLALITLVVMLGG